MYGTIRPMVKSHCDTHRSLTVHRSAHTRQDTEGALLSQNKVVQAIHGVVQGIGVYCTVAG